MSLIPLGFWGGRNFVEDGLKLYYDFAVDTCYPGSGTTVYNLAKNDFNGTVDGATFDATDGDGCFSFDGTNDAIKPSPLTFFNNELWKNNSQSYEFWFKTTSTANMRLMSVADTLNSTLPKLLQVAINSNLGTAQTGYLYFHIRNGNNTLYRERRGSTGYNTGLTDGNWHQFVGVIENTTTYVSNANYATQFRIYFDGTQVSSYTLSAETNENNAAITFEDMDFLPWIGAANARGTLAAPLNGKIGVVRGYSKALSDQDVLLNFNQYKTRYGL